jgi:hypothetical protein
LDVARSHQPQRDRSSLYSRRREAKDSTTRPLPGQEGGQPGTEIAKGVANITEAFGIEEKFGHFVLDNAFNIDTCAEELGKTFGFDPKHLRLWCMGHVVNPTAREMMFGDDADHFESEASLRKSPREELVAWRRKGAIGKLHDLIVWIYGSGQGKKRWHVIRKDILVEGGVPEGSIATHSLPLDVRTRWYASLRMILAAVEHEAALDGFILREEARRTNLNGRG